MAEQARLVIRGQGGVEAQYAAEFLADLTTAYNSILAFDTVTEHWAGDDYYYRGMVEEVLFRRTRSPRGLRTLMPPPPTPMQVREMVPFEQTLVLARVELASPGVWEFLGSLNPLEVTRKYLCDKHEREKDRRYRNDAEQRRLELENAMLENKALSERIELLRSAGATDADLAPLINTLLREPLERLELHQSRGVISDARLSPPDKGDGEQDKG